MHNHPAPFPCDFSRRRSRAAQVLPSEIARRELHHVPCQLIGSCLFDGQGSAWGWCTGPNPRNAEQAKDFDPTACSKKERDGRPSFGRHRASTGPAAHAAQPRPACAGSASGRSGHCPGWVPFDAFKAGIRKHPKASRQRPKKCKSRNGMYGASRYHSYGTDPNVRLSSA